MAPSIVNGGDWIARSKATRSRPPPRDHVVTRIVESNACSGLFTGSGSMPTSVSRPDAVASARSRSTSGSVPGAGVPSEGRSESGRPIALPGV
jgi:hypothetical protein